MRRTFALTGVALALAVLASAAQAVTVTQDSASGGGSWVFGTNGASFFANSGANGERPAGTAFWHDHGNIYSGPVTCLNVTGDRATIGFENTGGSPTGGGAFLFVQDYGTAGGASDGLFAQLLGAAPSVCPASGPVSPPFGEPSISVTVRDDELVPARRMVGKGSLNGTTGGTASYAYIVNCDPAPNSAAPFEVRFGTQRFRLTATSKAGCVDGSGLTDQSGNGSGTLSSGGPGTIDWGFFDGGAGGASDFAAITIRNSGGTIVFQGFGRPGPFPGSTQTTGNSTLQNVP